MSTTMAYEVVKYILISLLSLMIFCTTLAIILVCLVSTDYNNNNLNDRSLGIIIILTIITIVFLFGLIGVSKSHFPTVLIFAFIDLFLLVITFFGSYSTRGGNMGAFLIFLITTVLSFIFSSIIWRKYISKKSATNRFLDYENYHFDQNPNHFQQQQSEETYWTVESNDRKLLIGERYSV